ncbi:MAG: hypothetical protein DRR42_19070 [Gammaproteobacteria bacterium]|nr:MAG: hypothetical protein DRR42_19070 [Gammaproteobacteria bacterium]
MILSRRHQFIFIANLKTASTSIENSLAPHADIHLKTTKCGKHMSMSEVDDLILTKWPKRFLGDTAKLFRFGVMREPLSYVTSIYNSHTKKAFRGAPHYTGDKTFEEFLERVLVPKKRWQLRDQHRKFSDVNGRPIVDFIIRYENFHDDFQHAMNEIGLAVKLPHSNKSPKKLRSSKINTTSRHFIEESYKSDYEFYESYAGKLGLR